MKRLFLSAPTTCALLLGAGLLLRVHAALRLDAPAQDVAGARAAREWPWPLDFVQRPAGARGRQGPVRKATAGVHREQSISQPGKAATARQRRAAARGRARARMAEARRATEASQASERGRQ
jgi:hypothetical protein